MRQDLEQREQTLEQAVLIAVGLEDLTPRDGRESPTLQMRKPRLQEFWLLAEARKARGPRLPC